MTALSCRDYEVVPSILSCLHRTYECDPAATEKSTLAIVGFANERPCHEDLTSFTTDFRTEAEAATFIVIGWTLMSTTRVTLPKRRVLTSRTPRPWNIRHRSSSTIQVAMRLLNGKFAHGDVWWFNHILREPDIPQTISV